MSFQSSLATKIDLLDDSDEEQEVLQIDSNIFNSVRIFIAL